MVKNRYEVLKSIELHKLISLGIVSIHLFDWITIYEWYIKERQTNNKMQSYANTSEFRKQVISEKTVRNIVKWMETKD